MSYFVKKCHLAEENILKKIFSSKGGIIAVIILVALACYGFQMIRLFFKF